MPNKMNIFNLELLKARQDRAKALGPSTYLDKFVVDQAHARLSEINRKFNDVAIVGGKACFWAKHLGINNAHLVADEEKLNLKRGAYELIIHALSLHWYNDPVGQLIQLRNALTTDGLMLAFLFGGNTLCELRAAFQRSEIRNDNGMSPRVAPMAELRDVGDLLVRAGFALSVADSIDLVVSYSTPLALLYDLRRMGETNIMVGRRKNFLKRNTLKECMEIYSRDFYEKDDQERIKATFQIFCLTGWAPSENQQKPLKPGTAKKKLSDALNSNKF